MSTTSVATEAESGVSPLKMLRFKDLVREIGLGRRTIERMIHSGEFPKPDRRVGRLLLWRAAKVAEWVAGGTGGDVA